MFLSKLIFFALWSILPKSSVSSQNCECGVGNEFQINFRIINGKEISPHTFPWLVYLTLNGGKMFCGGAIINDFYVLTAGHCVYSFQEDKLLVYVGGHNLHKDKGEPMKVAYYRLHPSFTRYDTHEDNDIALIKLTERIVFSNEVSPICLPIPGNYNNQIVTIAGWGITEKKADSDVPLSSELRILSDEECSQAKEVGKLFKPSENFCAYGYKTDTCQGDSGTPVIHEVRPYKYQILGVVSWGHGCAPSGIPGMYANVVHYVPWILENTRDANYCKA